MVSAGELTITGSIDTSMIERGFSKIKKSFERVKSNVKSFGADMVRIGQATAQVGKSLGLIASVGLTAMVGLAKSAPAVAPAMAQIGVEFQRLSRILGEQLRPYFEKFSDGFTKFVNFVDAHPNITKGFALTAGAITGVLALTKLITALTGAVSPGMLAALGIAGGIIGTGYAGAKAGEYIVDKTKGFLTSEAEQIPGTLESLRTVDMSAQQAAQSIREQGGIPNATMSAWTEGSRKAFLFRWWDSLWS